MVCLLRIDPKIELPKRSDALLRKISMSANALLEARANLILKLRQFTEKAHKINRDDKIASTFMGAVAIAGDSHLGIYNSCCNM
jgi:hypothetical protein